MAWPNSRLLDFIARSIPRISADFLNALQDWIIAVSTATITLKAVVVDGTGGAAATPVAGTVKVSRGAADFTLPLPAIVVGQLNTGQIAAMWGRFTGANGTDLVMQAGLGVHDDFGVGDLSLVYVNTGRYEIYTQRGFSVFGGKILGAAWATAVDDGVIASAELLQTGGGRFYVRVSLKSTAGSYVNGAFNAGAFGE